MDRQKELNEIQAILDGCQAKIKEIERQLQSTSEPKEPETWDDIPSSGSHFFEWGCGSSKHYTELEKFIKRLEIADYCGRREFVLGEENWQIQKTNRGWIIESYSHQKEEGTNYFDTKEAAEKYLKICLNSNLL